MSQHGFAFILAAWLCIRTSHQKAQGQLPDLQWLGFAVLEGGGTGLGREQASRLSC